MVVFKIIPIPTALEGYSNSGLLTVVVLFIVAQGFTATGGADYFITKLLGSPNDIMLAQVRMCLIAAAISSFINDTPVFLIMLPIVLTWAAKTQLNVRQLLIPLSYCCLLGGLNTSIGTSTNLVVTGQFNSKILDPTRYVCDYCNLIETRIAVVITVTRNCFLAVHTIRRECRPYPSLV